MIEININPNVLVIGGGMAGILAAQKIVKQGYPVSIIDQTQGFKSDPCYEKETIDYYKDTIEKLKENNKVKFLENTYLTKLNGTYGNFSTYLKVNNKIERANFGAIVVATPYDLGSLFEEYGLSPSSSILSLSNTKTLFFQNNISDKTTVVFLTSFQEESNPVNFKNIILDAIKIVEKGANVYIVVNNVKTAAPGLEKEILYAKNQGVIIIKSHKKPNLQVQEDKIKILVYDQIIKKDIEIYTNYVILEDRILPNKNNGEISEILGIHKDEIGFLQTNNVRRIPVTTNKKGIFAVGSAIGIKPFPYIIVDAIDVSCEIKNLLGNKDKIYVKETISIDQEKCVRCLTCYRVCPHGAIYWDVDRVAISSLMCENCGVCTAECPMNAIQIEEYSDDKIKAKLNNILNSKGKDPLIIGFCCKNSAFEAANGAKTLGDNLLKGFKVIKIPCAGKIDIDYVLEALVKGADGVIIGACYKDNCKSEKGNVYASYRIKHIKNILTKIGIDPNRVELINISSNMYKEFSLKVENTYKNIFGDGT